MAIPGTGRVMMLGGQIDNDVTGNPGSDWICIPGYHTVRYMYVNVTSNMELFTVSASRLIHKYMVCYLELIIRFKLKGK